MRDLRPILDFARGLAVLAEAEIMPRFRTVAVELKPDGTEVTEADRRAEAVMRDAIGRAFPEAAVLGEEFGGDERPCRGPQWILDPLDGTAPFALGLPLFGTLVALLDDGVPLLGVVHMPALRETVFAACGLGCWAVHDGGEPVAVRVAPPAPLSRALVSASGVQGSDLVGADAERRFALSALIRAAGRFRFIGDCPQHAWVCRGRVHAAVDPIMRAWDTAALVPCLREAGGVASTVEGDRDGVVFGGSLVASCCPALHDDVLAALRALRRDAAGHTATPPCRSS